uniref:Uncharacterized protein n=1 Tax=Meloidogyne incognita TaxID=6306 RepID=A0A914L6R8_MELIC
MSDGCNIYEFFDKNNTECIRYTNRIFDAMWNGRLNPYDLYRKCGTQKYYFKFNTLGSQNKYNNRTLK